MKFTALINKWRRRRKAEKTVDLFAGPGGWDLAALALGIETLGVEYDDAACETRAAAGLLTLQHDVAELDPADFCPFSGLIASPPCPTFSMAGSGGGRKLTDEIKACLADLARGEDNRQKHRDDAYALLEPNYWTDEQRKAKQKGRTPDREKSAAIARRDADMSILVCEPLRWALAAKPEWIACEQVETVLPIWEALAEHLKRAGYNVWTGIVSAEQYGVPQTRKRAILLASLTERVGRPKPTHQRYVAPKLKLHEKQETSLFDDAPVEIGEREHIVHREDRHLPPWISMAQALGWDTGGEVQYRRGGDRLEEAHTTDRPSDTVTSRADRWQVGFPRRADTESNRAGEGVVEIDGVEYRARDLRDGDEPALAVTEKARSWQRWHYRNGNQKNAAIRAADEPAPTLHFGHALNSGVEWTQTPDEPWRPTAMDARQQRDGRTGEPNAGRSVDEPAQTIAGETRNNQWVGERPATTVAGDPRIAEPGHKRDEADPDAPGRMTNAVRVTVDEAAMLQSFPAGYPWHGSQTKIFEQIGNAVPPLLALHVLTEATKRPPLG